MFKRTLLNNSGVSLLELIAAITIISFSGLVVFQMLKNNYMLTIKNREKAVLTNVAYGALNYMTSQDYEFLDSLLGTENYLEIDADDCSSINFNGEEVCSFILAPKINNIQYTSDDIKVYLIPYNDTLAYQALQNNPPTEFSKSLVDYIKNIEIDDSSPELNNQVIRIIVVVKSKSGLFDEIIYEDVVTNENYQ